MRPPARFLRITVGSRGEVVVNYLIFAGILHSQQFKLPMLLAIEPKPKTLAKQYQTSPRLPITCLVDIHRLHIKTEHIRANVLFFVAYFL